MEIQELLIERFRGRRRLQLSGVLPEALVAIASDANRRWDLLQLLPFLLYGIDDAFRPPAADGPNTSPTRLSGSLALRLPTDATAGPTADPLTEPELIVWLRRGFADDLPGSQYIQMEDCHGRVVDVPAVRQWLSHSSAADFVAWHTFSRERLRTLSARDAFRQTLTDLEKAIQNSVSLRPHDSDSRIINAVVDRSAIKAILGDLLASRDAARALAELPTESASPQSSGETADDPIDTSAALSEWLAQLERIERDLSTQIDRTSTWHVPTQRPQTQRLDRATWQDATAALRADTVRLVDPNGYGEEPFATESRQLQEELSQKLLECRRQYLHARQQHHEAERLRAARSAPRPSPSFVSRSRLSWLIRSLQDDRDAALSAFDEWGTLQAELAHARQQLESLRATLSRAVGLSGLTTVPVDFSQGWESVPQLRTAAEALKQLRNQYESSRNAYRDFLRQPRKRNQPRVPKSDKHKKKQSHQPDSLTTSAPDSPAPVTATSDDSPLRKYAHSLRARVALDTRLADLRHTRDTLVDEHHKIQTNNWLRVGANIPLAIMFVAGILTTILGLWLVTGHLRWGLMWIGITTWVAASMLKISFSILADQRARWMTQMLQTINGQIKQLEMERSQLKGKAASEKDPHAALERIERQLIAPTSSSDHASVTLAATTGNRTEDTTQPSNTADNKSDNRSDNEWLARRAGLRRDYQLARRDYRIKRRDWQQHLSAVGLPKHVSPRQVAELVATRQSSRIDELESQRERVAQLAQQVAARQSMLGYWEAKLRKALAECGCSVAGADLPAMYRMLANQKQFDSSDLTAGETDPAVDSDNSTFVDAKDVDAKDVDAKDVDANDVDDTSNESGDVSQQMVASRNECLKLRKQYWRLSRQMAAVRAEQKAVQRYRERIAAVQQRQDEWLSHVQQQLLADHSDQAKITEDRAAGLDEIAQALEELRGRVQRHREQLADVFAQRAQPSAHRVTPAVPGASHGGGRISGWATVADQLDSTTQKLEVALAARNSSAATELAASNGNLTESPPSTVARRDALLRSFTDGKWQRFDSSEQTVVWGNEETAAEILRSHVDDLDDASRHLIVFATWLARWLTDDRRKLDLPIILDDILADLPPEFLASIVTALNQLDLGLVLMVTAERTIAELFESQDMPVAWIDAWEQSSGRGG
ncbi:MAG: hypothetical protein R3E01_34665 [Pirellulaceae bacterium]